jgi:hypothetical protein
MLYNRGPTKEETVAKANQYGLWSLALYGGDARPRGAGGWFAEWIARSDTSAERSSRWIGEQEVGKPLAAFRGSRAELEFLQEHVKCE